MRALSSRNFDIQVLRALAILLVIVQHMRGRLPTPAWYQRLFEHAAFWPGVDIFFAISGFLICSTFLRDLQQQPTPGVAVRRFWQRRFWRLFPALAVWVPVSVLVSVFAASSPGADPAKVAASGLAALAGYANFHWVECIRAADALATCGSSDFNGVAWSLSLEWQLYALLTGLMLLAGARRAVAALLAISIALSFLPAPSWSYPWAFRPQAFALGAALYLGMRQARSVSAGPHSALLARLMLLAGLALCVIAPVRLPQPFVVPTIAVAATLCLFSSWRGNSYSGRLATPLVWIGERSYSIYLCHLPLIHVVREVTHRTIGSDAVFPLAILPYAGFAVLLALAAELSYRLIEVPLRRRGHATGNPEFAGTQPA